MKAVIMAGGEGTRLRPLTLSRPKPMTPLLGRPVMEHILGLLKRHGITEVCVTLCCRPQTVTEYFGDGSRLGMKLFWFIEEEPLGTAGSVKRCMDRLGDGDFLVISGDCVCDLDLSKAVRFHQEAGGAATLVLYRHPTPLEYGLVVTGGDGRVERFVEKPAWGQVTCDLINTGIYILSPAAMARTPENTSYDFGRDLFPALLQEGAPLYGCPLEGYWCDMGDCRAYLQCARDALEGRVKLDMGLPRRAPGVWSAGPLPENASVEAPCWIGRDAVLGAGSLIGPGTVLERGVQVGERASVRRSVLLEGARAEPGAALDGAVLCRNSAAGPRSVLNAGSVLGENALAERGAVLLEGVKLWPGQKAPENCRLERSVTCGSQKTTLRFGDGGVIRGVLGEDVGPEALLALGSALGPEGRVGIGCSDAPGARMLARAAAAGAAAAGGEPLTHGLPCPAQGAWAAAEAALPVSLFVEQAGERVFLHLFDSLGLPLGRSRERKLEQALLQGELRRVRWDRVGALERLDVTERDWAEAVVRRAALGRSPLRRVAAAVEGDEPENAALRLALKTMGCHVEERWQPGIPAFRGSHGGFYLTARDEKGALLDSGQLLALEALIEMENGGGKVAVPAGGSAAVEMVAAGYSGTALRLDRDGEKARQLYAALPWLREAASAAVRICARMGVSGQSLENLISKTPRFHAWKREVPLASDRGRVMRALSQERSRTAPGEGLRFRAGSGWVYLTPLARRAALQVMAEGPDLELAAELCDFYAGRAAALDRSLSNQNIQENGL